VTNREFSKALGRVLHRPAVVPVPTVALKLLFGEGAYVIASGVRAVPRRALEHGFEFRHPRLDDALADLLARR
jgi:NAD dependent epimerase/dehydratase family enzyme